LLVWMSSGVNNWMVCFRGSKQIIISVTWSLDWVTTTHYVL
jgi:hypothetical protein